MLLIPVSLHPQMTAYNNITELCILPYWSVPH